MAGETISRHQLIPVWIGVYWLDFERIRHVRSVPRWWFGHRDGQRGCPDWARQKLGKQKPQDETSATGL